MSMTYQSANAWFAANLEGEDVFVWLHTGDPGPDGVNAVAEIAAAEIDRKEVDFDDSPEPETNGPIDEQVIYSTSEVEWTGAEIDAAQVVTHFSLWPTVDGVPGGAPDSDPLIIGELTESKTIGSDGITIPVGDLLAAIQVYVKEV